MQTYEIIPINVGEFTQFEKSAMISGKGIGEKIVIPIVMFLIKGKDSCVLVDTGCSDPEASLRDHSYPLRRSPDQHPVQALKNLGIDVDDIEIVVNTHLHWDHCYNNNLFKKAKIYVQKRELQYAICPLRQNYRAYEASQIGMFPPWLHAVNQIQAVEGDVTILPGIDLIYLPGHTPGFQGVLVNTNNGKYLLAGDNLNLFENIDTSEKREHTIAGNYYSLPEYVQSLDKMNSLYDHILPGHDMKLFDYPKYPHCEK